MTKNPIAIAIDGPAAAGKSTVAKIVAHQLAYIYIDTGAMYRALTLKALKNKVPLDDEIQLTQLLDETDIQLTEGDDGQLVQLDGCDVTEEIRAKNVTNHVSQVAKHPAVREKMVQRQRAFAANQGVVMDGRDIGTQVLPQAELKLFFNATVEERAKRRHEENLKRGFASDFAQIKNEIAKRDLIDSKRKTAPLIKAEDAIEIDTTSVTIDEVVQFILQKVSQITDVKEET
ncbi:MAG TPA: (d)CMP kinase [Bacillota bacterium]|nr:(d)CMP kinase [Bacillota bacterium]